MSTSDVRRACPPCVGVTTLRGGAGEAHHSPVRGQLGDKSQYFQDTSRDRDGGGGHNSLSQGECETDKRF